MPRTAEQELTMSTDSDGSTALRSALVRGFMMYAVRRSCRHESADDWDGASLEEAERMADVALSVWAARAS